MFNVQFTDPAGAVFENPTLNYNFKYLKDCGNFVP